MSIVKKVTKKLVMTVELDCGHVARVSITLPCSEELAAPIQNLKEEQEYPCADCSSDKAKELEESGKVDLVAAQDRFEKESAERNGMMHLREHHMTDTAASGSIAPATVEVELPPVPDEHRTVNVVREAELDHINVTIKL